MGLIRCSALFLRISQHFPTQNVFFEVNFSRIFVEFVAHTLVLNFQLNSFDESVVSLKACFESSVKIHYIWSTGIFQFLTRYSLRYSSLSNYQKLYTFDRSNSEIVIIVESVWHKRSFRSNLLDAPKQTTAIFL